MSGHELFVEFILLVTSVACSCVYVYKTIGRGALSDGRLSPLPHGFVFGCRAEKNVKRSVFFIQVHNSI